jgi:hypothetical protein
MEVSRSQPPVGGLPVAAVVIETPSNRIDWIEVTGPLRRQMVSFPLPSYRSL